MVSQSRISDHKNVDFLLIIENFSNLLKKDESNDIEFPLETCLLSNVSLCEPTKAERFVVTVYNPLERPVSHYVRLPVPDGTYQITGPDDIEPSDLLDSISSFSYLPETPHPKELVFRARMIPAFGVKLYYVERTNSKSQGLKAVAKPKIGTEVGNFFHLKKVD